MSNDESTQVVFQLSEFTSARRSHADGSKTDCVMIARRDGRAEVRDSKLLRSQSVAAYEANSLPLSEEELDAFLAGFLVGDVSASPVEVTVREDGMTVFRSSAPAAAGIELVYTPSEILAFRDGVENGEFTAKAKRALAAASA